MEEDGHVGARDYYDLWHLVRLPSGRVDWSNVSAILPQKCALRDVSVESIDDIFEPVVIAEVRAGWKRVLAPFVPELPDVSEVLAQVRAGLTSKLGL